MATTTDSKNPDLGWGEDESRTPQNKVYLVLSDEERAKGFIRPVRHSYMHVGLKPTGKLRDLTPIEIERYGGEGYVKFEEYEPNERGALGRYWTQEELDNHGCGVVTTMAQSIAETYAREPKFYGATYCMGCQRHINVNEFVWIEDGTAVGS